jgi:hypothetical protein
LVAIGVWCERAVGDAFEKEAGVSRLQKLPVRDDSRARQRGSQPGKVWDSLECSTHVV